MEKYYLAIDIGASSGRHIIGSVQDGKIKLEEMHRFENGMIQRDGHLCWDYELLWNHIKDGIKKCVEAGKVPVSVGVDTWGVDYVLLDDRDNVLGETYGYRDSRMEGMDKLVEKLISQPDLYARSGIEKMSFNSIYQLMADKTYRPEVLNQAASLLFVPDYFHFRLTGKKVNEYTEATTSALVNAKTKSWDGELIDLLGFPQNIFREIKMPGTNVGQITDSLRDEFGCSFDVVLPSSHDTASAILAVPTHDDDFVYISSGTWSLLGAEKDEPNCSELARQNSFTNEGGYGEKICYLRNIMGLWMIQSLRRNFNNQYSYLEIDAAAIESKDFPSRVDVNADCFMAPENMAEAVKEYCRNTNQQVPETLGELATVIYTSLAECYAKTIRGIEESSGRTYSRIHIVGGGGNIGYLNRLTAEISGKEVHVGPTEGTALGNIIAQMITAGVFKSKEEARQMVAVSFGIKIIK